MSELDWLVVGLLRCLMVFGLTVTILTVFSVVRDIRREKRKALVREFRMAVVPPLMAEDEFQFPAGYFTPRMIGKRRKKKGERARSKKGRRSKTKYGK